MNHPIPRKLIVILAVPLTLWFFYSATMSSSESPRGKVASSWGAESISKSDDVSVPQGVPVRHTYNAGMHELVGSVAVPTLCHMLFSRAVVHDAKRVTVAFETKENGGKCAEALSAHTFFIAFRADQEAMIDATINGVSVPLVSIPN